MSFDMDAFPPGWVGETEKYFYYNALYPNATVAIVGALALKSAICGRFVNVSGAGLNIMIAIVGGNGIGKEAASSGISRLISSAAALAPCIHEFIGPSSLASPEAAHKRLAKTPSVLIFIGELGLKLKIWCAPDAPSALAGLIAFLLDVYGKSGRGNRLGARENSDREKGAAAVESPNLVALGDTTESTLLAALNEQTIANGFAQPWVYAFAADKREPVNKARQQEPTQELSQYWANLAATSLSYQRGGTVFDIPLNPEAQAIDDEIEAFTSAKING